MNKMSISSLWFCLALTCSVAYGAPEIIKSGSGGPHQLSNTPGSQNWKTVSSLTFTINSSTPVIFKSGIMVYANVCYNTKRSANIPFNPKCDKPVFISYRLILGSRTNPSIQHKRLFFKKSLEFSFVNHSSTVGSLDAVLNDSITTQQEIEMTTPLLGAGKYVVELQVAMGGPGFDDYTVQGLAPLLIEAAEITLIRLQ